jgi:uncharacterized protein with von Willebrand factor type A (vWA) domain
MALELKKGDHIIVAVDQSGSMGELDPKCNGLRKWNWMEETMLSYVKAAERFEPTGISLHLFADRVEAYQNLSDPAMVKQIFEKHSPGGGTHTERVINSAWQEHRARGSASSYLLVFTDGDASDRGALMNQIASITKQLKNPEEFRILFLPVGTPDADLSAFMDELDEHMDQHGAVEDIVGVVDPTVVDFEGAIADAIGSTTSAADVAEGHGAAGKVTPHLETPPGS